MKNIVKKIIIWITSIILVLSFMFTNLSIQNRSISIRLNDDQFTSVNADFKETLLATLAILAYNVWLSMVANEVAPGVQVNLEYFTEKYIDWYTDNTNEAQLKRANEGSEADWQSQQELVDYLMATQQINELGELQTQNAVLKKEYLQSIYNSTVRLYNDSLSFGNVEFKSYNYSNNRVFVIPVIDGVNPFLNTYDTYIPYSGYVNNEANWALIAFNQKNYNISTELLEKSTDFYRLKLTVKNSSINDVKYSPDLTSDQLNTINTMNKYLIVLRGGYYSNYKYSYYLIPLFTDKSWAYSLSKKIELNVPDLFSTSYEFSYANIPSSDFFHKNDYVNYNNTPVINIDDITEKVDDSNYYVVPGTTVTTPTLPTPLPQEDEDDYIYNPTPTNPDIPTIDKPNIGTGMPDTPAQTDVPDKSSSIPLPGVDDILDGTFFKDIVLWFTAWLALTISNVNDWWSLAWSNLTISLNWIGNGFKDLIFWLGDSLLLPLNQANNYLKAIKENTTPLETGNWFTDATSWLTGLFVPTDLNLKFTALMDFFNTKFGLLLYPFELIIDVVERFLLVEGVDRISFHGYTEVTTGVMILPAFNIDIGDMRSQYDFLDYIFATIKMLVTTFFIFNFIRFLYYYYEDVRDS